MTANVLISNGTTVRDHSYALCIIDESSQILGQELSEANIHSDIYMRVFIFFLLFSLSPLSFSFFPPFPLLPSFSIPFPSYCLLVTGGEFCRLDS